MTRMTVKSAEQGPTTTTPKGPPPFVFVSLCIIAICINVIALMIGEHYLKPLNALSGERKALQL